MKWYLICFFVPATAVWFFKPQLQKAGAWIWTKLTPWIKRGEAAALAEANKVVTKK